jgi:hypothetical protein
MSRISIFLAGTGIFLSPFLLALGGFVLSSFSVAARLTL